MRLDGQRILILSNFFTQGHGGAPESVLLLARELSRRSISVDVSCRSGLLRDVQALDVLPKADDGAVFRRRRPDMTSYAALFIAGSWIRQAPFIALRAVWAGIPIVYSAKGCLCRAEFERLRDMRRIPYFFLVEWLPFLLARRIVFSSHWEQHEYVIPGRFWKRRAALVSEPFRGEGGRADPVAAAPAVTGEIRLGFLAEISPRKGLLELIAGLGHYLTSRPDAKLRLVVAGRVRRGSEAYFESCRALAQNNGAAAYVDWCEPVRGEKRRDFYRSLDMFMCPSRFESFGLTLLEALWQGVPVCAGPALGVLEHLQPDVPVLRLGALDKEKIAEAMDILASDRNGWRGKGRRWERRHALKRTNEEIAGDFVDLLAGQDS